MATHAWRLAIGIALVGGLFVATQTSAQDYRARVQGAVLDESQGTLAGATVTLRNDATDVAVTYLSDAQGHYIFDFVEPGDYTLAAELGGFKKAEQKKVRVQQRNSVTANLILQVGDVQEQVFVETPPVSMQFKSGSADITLERQLVDQAPISGRNPYNLSGLDPTITVSTSTNENRPYHHAYANDYDAGGGTRRANDVPLDGVPLGASY